MEHDLDLHGKIAQYSWGRKCDTLPYWNSGFIINKPPLGGGSYPYIPETPEHLKIGEKTEGNFEGADLTGVNLLGVKITKKQLENMIVVGLKKTKKGKK